MHPGRLPHSSAVASLCLAALAIAPTAQGVINGQEPLPTDTRFDAVAAFSHTTWLSEEEPGQPDDGDNFEHNHFGNGTLIASDLMVLAKHLVNGDAGNPPPAGEYSFRFRRKPDGSLGSVTLGWQSFHQVEVEEFIFTEGSHYSDICFARLSEPVTHITPLALATPTDVLALTPGTDTVIVAGWGKEGPGFDEGPARRLNYAEPLLASVLCSFLGVLEFDDPSNPCDCGINNFDSGGAMLIPGPSEGALLLAGVIGNPAGGGLAIPITEPADAAPLNRDRRHDPVCAFGATDWLSEEPSGQPDDGDDREHHYIAGGVLISPTQVLLHENALGFANPNGVQYSTGNLPPAGLFSVRFRYRTDGSVGSIAGGWDSFHQVAVQSYTVDPGPHSPGTGLVIANLATSVTHIEPMAVADVASVQALEANDPLRISGWAWGSDAPIGLRTRSDDVVSLDCRTLFIDGPNASFPDSCGGSIYSFGAAVVVERTSLRYTDADLENYHTAEATMYDPISESEVEVVYTTPSDPAFNGEYFVGARPAYVAWFELVALGIPDDVTHARLAIASTLVDECHAYDCDRQPLPTLHRCADFNDDGDIDATDLALLQAATPGPCADCEDCPFDVNRDCSVGGEGDFEAFNAQQATNRCPCRADFDQDGDVDEDDMNYLLANLGPCPCDEDCPADLNGDRTVTEADLTLFMDLPNTVCTY